MLEETSSHIGKANVLLPNIISDCRHDFSNYRPAISWTVDMMLKASSPSWTSLHQIPVKQ